jgi:hypothetical protein
LGRTSWECYAQTNLCQTYYFYPFAYGSESIRQHFVSLSGAAPIYSADIISNYNYLNNCFSNGHSIDNFSLRFQNLNNLFSNRIQSTGNTTQNNCSANGVENFGIVSNVSLRPNPANEFITINVPKATDFLITDVSGKDVKTGVITPHDTKIDVREIPVGMYFIRLLGSQNQIIKIFIQR